LRNVNRSRRAWWTGRIQSRDVGDSLRIVPYWEERFNPTNRIEVIIDPGPAFGSGDHPATVMALELLEVAIARAFDSGRSPDLLDIGTGTGILAISGKLLGAGFAVGMDTDAAAVFTAKRNLVLNGLDPGDSVEFFVGHTEAVSAVFDVVTANLNAPLLLNLCEALALRTGRFLIVSGVADAMCAEVFRTYCSGGLDLVQSMTRDGWNAGLFGSHLG
jgi:ribosomal protein L11 methyltransferase